METVEYLQKKLPITNVILKDVQCINPGLRGTEKSKVSISLVQHLKKISGTDYKCDAINTEWCMYAFEKFDQTYTDDQDICKYWSQVSKIKDDSGMPKYPNLSAFAKSCLVMSHGNAIPERGFSINNAIVVPSRSSLSELCIRSIRLCKDYIYRQR